MQITRRQAPTTRTVNTRNFRLRLDNDNGVVRAVFNNPLNNVSKVWLTGFFIDTPSANNCRIMNRDNYGLNVAETMIASSAVAALNSPPSNAYYIDMTPATQRVDYGTPELFLVATSTVPCLREMTLDITTEAGLAFTFNRFTLWGYIEYRDDQLQQGTVLAPFEPTSVAAMNAYDQSGYSRN